MMWVSLLVHREMETFISGGFRTNAILNTAYVHFMTEEHGKMSSFGTAKAAKGATTELDKTNHSVTKVVKSVENLKTRVSRTELKLKLKPMKRGDLTDSDGSLTQ